MKYIIRHNTHYVYQQPVSQCHNIAYLLPRNTAQQTLLEYRIETTPAIATQQIREDYFGNRLVQFSIEDEHSELDITVVSKVAILPQLTNHLLDFGRTCAQVKQRLNDLSNDNNLRACEFMLASPMAPLHSDYAAYAADCFDHDRPFLSAVHRLTQKIFQDFTYDANFSDVATPLIDVMKHRRGVCQDFAHLAIACLRASGFAAAYVSGYLETLPPPGKPKLIGADASHAWFSVYIPDEGWFDFDPTNNGAAGAHHITTAWGRDYTDVPPLKGIIFGGGDGHTLHVSVDVQMISNEAALNDH